jgi:four helix bundle protein
MEEIAKIKSFSDLIAWRRGHELVLFIYQITKIFPQNEQFGLVSQMRRAAVSITSNITEGFYRGSYKEKKHFYLSARASLGELQNQLLISRDIKYLNLDKFTEISQKSVEVHKLLNGLIRGCQRMIK